MQLAQRLYETADLTMPTEGKNNVTDLNAKRRSRRRGSAREAKRAARNSAVKAQPYIKRKIPVFNILDEEQLTLIERNADRVLEEIGIEFRDDAEALQMWRDAGADVKGERVHFPNGLCRKLITENAPSIYTQHARNPEKSVQIGGPNVVLVPACLLYTSDAADE